MINFDIDMYKIHIHSDYSNIRLLDSINTLKGLVKRCRDIGAKGFVLTDHECLSGHIKANELAKENKDITIGLANEIYLTKVRESGQKYFHFLLIAKDALGHKALRELSSNTWLNKYTDRGMERVPTLKSELEEIVNKYPGHLIATSACLGGELSTNAKNLNDARAIGDRQAESEAYSNIVEFITFCKRLFGDDFYIECAPNDIEPQISVNKTLKNIARKFDIKMVYGDDAHFLKKEDASIHKAYLNSKGGERETEQFYKTAYVQEREEVFEYLSHSFDDEFINELFYNNAEIFDKIEFYDLSKSQQIPEVDVTNYPKKPVTILEYISNCPILSELRVSDNIQERYWINECEKQLQVENKYTQTYLDRLEEEARTKRVIGEKLNTCMFAYPITLKHFIDLFWECGSTVGAGRGSACSGLNHYLLGITQLDPIEWNLPFWRYMNDERVELGDIDIDLAPSKRPTIFKEIRKMRGELGIAQVATFGTEGSRSAILTACRGYRSEEYTDGIDSDVAQYMSSLIPSERGFLWSLQDVVYGNESKDRKPVTTFINEVNQYPGLLEIMTGIEGLINKRSSHASGVILYGEDPYETACFMRTPSGDIITQYDLHDCERAGDVKYDFLLTQVQDIIITAIELMQNDNVIEKDKTLREIYNKYLHPSVLPINDNRIWDALAENSVLKCFQFDSPVGATVAKKLKPQTPLEMSDANSLMRLMAPEKGAELPMDKYARFKNDISLWYKEMDMYGITKEQQEILKPYFLPSYGVPPQQEQMMTILMDEKICHFTLKEGNAARKIVGKKQMDKIPELQEKIFNQAETQSLAKYIWDAAIKPQLGYSFSLIHSLAYSFVGIQTLYLATNFNPIYWNTACLIVDSGSVEDEEASESSTDYAKMAKAINTIISRGIKVSLANINKSDFGFKADAENNEILYGMKGIANVGDDLVYEIINNRPYASMADFLGKIKINRQAMVQLIKAGAFDKIENKSRIQIMANYIWVTCDKKKRLTMQNFNGLVQAGLIPYELEFERKVFNFNKYLKANCKKGTDFILDSHCEKFYNDNFNGDEMSYVDGNVVIDQKEWDKKYKKIMEKAKLWLSTNHDATLDEFNKILFKADWNKYALGNISSWEMESICFYYHEHELAHINKEKYGIVDFSTLPEEPEIEYTFKKGMATIPIYKLTKVVGTVIAKNKAKSSISLLTVDGVVNVKFRNEYFSLFDKQISEKQADGTKKVMEKSWFGRGSMLMLTGYRREDEFVTKKYKSTNSHQLYKIEEIDKEGNLILKDGRYGTTE